MYLIGIRKLKAELVGGPLPARRALPYVCVWFCITTLALIPEEVGSHARPVEWSWLLAIYSVVALLSGIALAYRANGGSDGVDFVARLLAVWWVVGMRVFLVLALPIAALSAIWQPTASSPGAPLFAELVATVAFTLPGYWRAAVHLKDVRTQADARKGAQVPGVI